jgi:hypothetical protein
VLPWILRLLALCGAAGYPWIEDRSRQSAAELSDVLDFDVFGLQLVNRCVQRVPSPAAALPPPPAAFSTRRIEGQGAHCVAQHHETDAAPHQPPQNAAPRPLPPEPLSFRSPLASSCLPLLELTTPPVRVSAATWRSRRARRDSWP